MPLATPDAPSPVEQKAIIREAAHAERANVVAGMSDVDRLGFHAAVELHAKGKPREALVAIATNFRHGGSWQETARNYIHTGVDMKGNRTARDTAESARVTAIEAQTSKTIDYLKQGYDGLINAGDRAYLRGQVEGFIRGNPGLLKALGEENTTTSPPTIDIPQETLEGLLRDRKFMGRVAERMNAIYDPSKFAKDTDQSLIASESKVQVNEEELKELKRKETEEKQQKKDLLKQKEDYAKDVTYPSTSLGKSASKETIQKELSVHPDVVKYQLAKRHYDRVAALDLGKGKSAALTTAAANLHAATASDKVQEYELLTAEKEDIAAGIKTTDAGLAKTKTEIVIKQGEIAAAKAAVSTARPERQTSAADFEQLVESVIAGSAQDHLNERIQELFDEYPVYKAESGKLLQDKADEAIKTEIQRRWTELKTKGKLFGLRKGIVVSVEKTETINKDIDLIKSVDTNTPPDPLFGPKSYIKAVLTSSGLNADEVTRLMADKTFVDAQMKSLIPKVIGAKIAAKGELDSEMLSRLHVEPWGKEVTTSMIQNTKDAEAKAKIEEMSGKPLAETTLEDVKKKKGDKGSLAVLLLALGIIGAKMVMDNGKIEM